MVSDKGIRVVTMGAQPDPEEEGVEVQVSARLNRRTMTSTSEFFVGPQATFHSRITLGHDAEYEPTRILVEYAADDRQSEELVTTASHVALRREDGTPIAQLTRKREGRQVEERLDLLDDGVADMKLTVKQNWEGRTSGLGVAIRGPGGLWETTRWTYNQLGQMVSSSEDLSGTGAFTERCRLAAPCQGTFRECEAECRKMYGGSPDDMAYWVGVHALGQDYRIDYGGSWLGRLKRLAE